MVVAGGGASGGWAAAGGEAAGEVAGEIAGEAAGEAAGEVAGEAAGGEVVSSNRTLKTTGSPAPQLEPRNSSPVSPLQLTSSTENRRTGTYSPKAASPASTLDRT